MKTISVLIPSRGKPQACWNTIKSLFRMADNAARVEYVVRLDEDDQASYQIEGLPWVLPRDWHDALFIKTLVGPRLGYARIHDYYEECYQAARGELLLAYNDDMTVLSQGWDTAYEQALKNLPYGVASAEVDEGNGTNYEWAMPMVRRELCAKIGRFCAGTETCDRVFDAYARLSGRGVRAAVKLRHAWEPPGPGSEREKVYNYNCGHWAEMTAKWNADAQAMLRATEK